MLFWEDTGHSSWDRCQRSRGASEPAGRRSLRGTERSRRCVRTRFGLRYGDRFLAGRDCGSGHEAPTPRVRVQRVAAAVPKTH